jgi:hypothetical protein
MSNSERFHKVLALAINPAAHDGEAQAAFARLRDMAKQNPDLRTPPPPVASNPPEHTEQWRLTKISSYWLPIILDNLSGQAYDVGLRSKLACDFGEVPAALDITCTGPKAACDKFGQALTVLVDFINSHPSIG